jgi:tellurite resistance protein TerC
VSVPLWLWFAVLAVILVMLAIDLLAHRGERVVSLREAGIWSAIWVSLGLGFGLVVWRMFGSEAAGEYYAGYVIEKSLAVDNVFVFALIFAAFAVPRAYQHRVLFYGVLGALVMRAAFIAGGAVLIDRFAWILYVFGAFLVVTGIQMFRTRNSHSDPTQHPVLRLTRRIIPSTPTWHGTKFWVKENGRWLATPLFTVLVLVETTDLIFAVDSIPAIFAVTQEPFLVFTSNAFAILGLRAMYFLLADLMHRFIYLKVGLAAVLVFVGVKMLLLDVYKIPITLSLGVIGALVVGSVAASLWRTKNDPGLDETPPQPSSAVPSEPAAPSISTGGPS